MSSNAQTNYGPGIVIFTQSDVPTQSLQMLKLIRSLTMCSIDEAKNHLLNLPYHVSFQEMADAWAKQKPDEKITLKAMEDAANALAEDFMAIGVKCQVIESVKHHSSDSIPQMLAKLIEDRQNILLYGGTGVGKTAMFNRAAEIIGEKRGSPLNVLYFSMPTLQPEDFVGIPYPDQSGEPFFNYLMMRGLDKAEFIFLDELNRAHPKVLNGVMQLLHERSINGTNFPDLMCIGAAINPPDEGDYHGADELDIAVVERFDHFIPIKAQPNVEYYTKVLGNQHVAQQLVDWYNNELKDDQRAKCNPRRLEKIGRSFLLGHDISTAVYRKQVTLPMAILQQSLNKMGVITIDKLITNTDKLIEQIKAGGEQGASIQHRCGELLKQIFTKRDSQAMAKAARVIEVFPRDHIQAIYRDEKFRKFLQTSLERVNPAEAKRFTQALQELSEQGEEARKKLQAATKALIEGTEEIKAL